jgi:hypothetical protein
MTVATTRAVPVTSDRRPRRPSWAASAVVSTVSGSTAIDYPAKEDQIV